MKVFTMYNTSSPLWCYWEYILQRRDTICAIWHCSKHWIRHQAVHWTTLGCYGIAPSKRYKWKSSKYSFHLPLGYPSFCGIRPSCSLSSNLPLFQYLVEPECVSPLQVILVATADRAEGMPQSIRRCFRHEINMKSINEEQRRNLISETLHCVSTSADEVEFSRYWSKSEVLCFYVTFDAYFISISEYKWQVRKRFSSTNVWFHAKGYTCIGCRCWHIFCT